MARPTRPRTPPSTPPSVQRPDDPEPRVVGSAQRRRTSRASGAGAGAGAAAGRSPGKPAGRATATGRRDTRSGTGRVQARTGRSPSTPRLARVADLARARRARRWRPGRRTLGAAAGFLVVLVAVGWVLLASPWLRVQIIRTTGVDRTDPAAVQAIVAGQEGTPLARVNTRSLTAKVSALPLVAGVDITRSWPSTLVVTVHERQAVAAVPSTSGGVDLVDGEGTVLVHSAQAPDGVPVLDVDVAVAGGDALQAAIAVNASLPSAIRSQVSSITATSADAVSLQLADGPRVVWGDDSRPERKGEVLQRLLADEAASGASVLDVSAPDAPAVTP